MNYDYPIKSVTYKNLSGNPIDPEGVMDISSRVAFINSYKDFPMKTFREFLNEAPQYVQDDCEFGQEKMQRLMGNTKSLDSFRWSGVEDYRAVENKGDKESKEFTILTNDKSFYILGACYNGMFEVFAKLTFKRERNLKRVGSVIEVTGVNTHSDQRKRGFASSLYKSALNDGKTILSDAVQFKGAVKLWKDFVHKEDIWKTMIDDRKIKVSVYDIEKNKIIFNDITGVSDNEIWGGIEMKHIRLIASI